MDLQLKEFQLDRIEYFQIILGNYLRKNWWQYGILAMLWAYFIIYNKITKNVFETMDFAILILIPVAVIFYLARFWVFAREKEKKEPFRKMRVTLNDEAVIVTSANFETETIKWGDIIKVDRTSRYFIFFISKSLFIIVPVRAFHQKSELDILENFIKGPFRS